MDPDEIIEDRMSIIIISCTNREIRKKTSSRFADLLWTFQSGSDKHILRDNMSEVTEP
jgi:hypothetical protein